MPFCPVHRVIGGRCRLSTRCGAFVGGVGVGDILVLPRGGAFELQPSLFTGSQESLNPRHPVDSKEAPTGESPAFTMLGVAAGFRFRGAHPLISGPPDCIVVHRRDLLQTDSGEHAAFVTRQLVGQARHRRRRSSTACCRLWSSR
jgi:hypothetical protein